MKFSLIIICIGAFILIGGCSGDNNTNNLAPETEATYNVTFNATWSANTHPENFPTNPHFSRLVGATHKKSVSFWSAGVISTAGIEDVAERGSPGVFQAEIETAINSATAQYSLLGGGIGSSPGEVSMNFTVSIDFPLITLVSMIAPSPDWFVGVSGLSLLKNDAWVDTFTVELFLYDAGTDSGNSYTSANESTTPPVPIMLIEGFPALVDSEIHSVGTFSFKRQ